MSCILRSVTYREVDYVDALVRDADVREGGEAVLEHHLRARQFSIAWCRKRQNG